MPRGPAGGPRPFTQCSITVVFSVPDGEVKDYIERKPDVNKLNRQLIEVTGMTIDDLNLDMTNSVIRVGLEGGRIMKEQINMMEGVVSQEVSKIESTMILSD